MSETPQDRGRAFEVELAAETGLNLVPGSGNGVVKLDLADGELRCSLKYTDAASIRIDEKMLRELDDATSGVGGVGADVIGILVVRVGGLDRTVAIIDWPDPIVGILKGEIAAGAIPSSKDEQRRASAGIPSYLRD